MGMTLRLNYIMYISYLHSGASLCGVVSAFYVYMLSIQFWF